jgi:phosphosulfolactate synthase
MMAKAWLDLLEFPLPGRLAKPRDTGLTMVIDKGMGLAETKDSLAVAAGYIDMIKLGFGTAGLYPEDVLRSKIFMIRSFGIDVYPGGTFFEAALSQDKLREFINRVWYLGFSAIEVSDGTIKMPDGIREKAIAAAANIGLKVLTEVGKKHPADGLTTTDVISQVNRDLASGAYKVILEGRESGKGIGFYDSDGNLKKNEFETLLGEIPAPDCIIWEAPLKKQQLELITRFGSNVNLGNIAPGDILALESLRVGLRGDTLRQALKKVSAD